MTRVAAIALALAVSACASRPPPPLVDGHLSQEEATSRAVAVLSGTEYGTSRMNALQNIKQTVLMREGHNDCGPIARPVWAFHVHGPHDGWLYLDATTGEQECSSIPFLR